MKYAMHIRLQIAMLTLVCGAGVFAQNPADTDAEANYSKTIQERSDKIVATLEISDTNKFTRVSNLIAQQYRNLRDIHDARDAAIKTAKEQPKESADKRVKEIQDEATSKLGKLHGEYLAQLSVELTPAQVDKVKDGMTYGVLPLTYGVYLKEFPELKEDQKAQIHAWLVEARELAMDQGTSKEKHAVFGKYKGRINNYLSKAGYDLKKGEENLRK